MARRTATTVSEPHNHPTPTNHQTQTHTVDDAMRNVPATDDRLRSRSWLWSFPFAAMLRPSLTQLGRRCLPVSAPVPLFPLPFRPASAFTNGFRIAMSKKGMFHRGCETCETWDAKDEVRGARAW